MRKFKKIAVLAFAMALSVNTVAFAAEAESEKTENSYGYTKGQQENEERKSFFEKITSCTTDEERKALFESAGIGGDGPNSSSLHIDTEELVEAKIIDQETADKIKSAASQKNDALHSKYASKETMTSQERESFYESLKAEGDDEDFLKKLVSDKIITQDQANKILDYSSSNQ